jgi:hypothetical protein
MTLHSWKGFVRLYCRALSLSAYGDQWVTLIAGAECQSVANKTIIDISHRPWRRTLSDSTHCFVSCQASFGLFRLPKFIQTFSHIAPIHLATHYLPQTSLLKLLSSFTRIDRCVHGWLRPNCRRKTSYSTCEDVI